MSRSLNDVLRELDETGYSLVDLLKAVDTQLELVAACDQTRADRNTGRLVSLTRTNLETALLYAQKYEQESGNKLPLVLVED